MTRIDMFKGYLNTPRDTNLNLISFIQVGIECTQNGENCDI